MTAAVKATHLHTLQVPTGTKRDIEEWDGRRKWSAKAQVIVTQLEQSTTPAEVTAILDGPAIGNAPQREREDLRHVAISRWRQASSRHVWSPGAPMTGRRTTSACPAREGRNSHDRANRGTSPRHRARCRPPGSPSSDRRATPGRGDRADIEGRTAVSVPRGGCKDHRGTARDWAWLGGQRRAPWAPGGHLLRIRLDQLEAYLARDRLSIQPFDEDERVREILRKVG
jgi:hypothetical protein